MTMISLGVKMFLAYYPPKGNSSYPNGQEKFITYSFHIIVHIIQPWEMGHYILSINILLSGIPSTLTDGHDRNDVVEL